ncbi:hypothetical protein ACEPAF_4416 [Sanghuangporus sanghuang]
MDQEEPLQHQDFSIWEFVTCAKCNHAFSVDGTSGPSIPFWITECGHVLCNAHLNADQSCPSCNAQKIELMPLQKEMPPPFSDWFCSLPFKLDSLAQASKFQYERLAGTARYYKARYEQSQALFARFKDQISQMKAIRKENEALKSEIARFRGEWNDNERKEDQQSNNLYQQEPATYVNANGKRRLVDTGLAMSSPRSVHTPMGPPRITLPPNHDPPPSLSRLETQNGFNNQNSQPPGSGHFAQQYAYNPPQSSQTQRPAQQVLSNEQQAPIRQQQNERRLMPPPPPPVQNRQLGTIQQSRQIQRVMTPRVPDQAQFRQNHSQTQMPQLSNHIGGQQHRTQGTGAGQHQSLGQAPRRFIPPGALVSNTLPGVSNSQRFVPSTPNGSQQRFVPQTPTTGNGRRFMPPSSSGIGSTQGRSGFGNAYTQRAAFAPPG